MELDLCVSLQVATLKVPSSRVFDEYHVFEIAFIVYQRAPPTGGNVIYI